MEASNSFLQRPPEAEAQRFLDLWGSKAYGFFGLLIKVFRTRQCTRRLPCFRRESANDLERRFRATFLRCWRWLDTEEQQRVHQGLLWYFYRRDTALSVLHAMMLGREIEPENDPEFQQWQHSLNPDRSSPVALFRKLVRRKSSDMSEEEFIGLWEYLSMASQGTLLFAWYSITHRACAKLVPDSHGRKLVAQLTPRSPEMML